MDEKNVVQIGEGGFGRVLLLEDYNPPYVMKEVARGKDIDAQQKELLILKELTHKYIVKYLDQPIMKNFEINYSVLTIVKWAQEIFTALCYLKEQCIAHCDIKPENIFVNYDFICKLIKKKEIVDGKIAKIRVKS
ncbi:unnamed protein product, partial [Mesorhabditis belari]|uniref:non-specific serine/threonine protein kinase n=1 Tax=Mesorhabditis belari TaxID=2138241 RepID=A0AAF3EFV7_9BILA